jgi:uncharacterized protein (DUF1697 family)
LYLFHENDDDGDTFSERVGRRRRVKLFSVENLRRVRKVYPVLVVQDFSMAIGFMNRRLKLQLKQRLQEYKLRPNIHVRPL